MGSAKVISDGGDEFSLYFVRAVGKMSKDLAVTSDLANFAVHQFDGVEQAAKLNVVRGRLAGSHVTSLSDVAGSGRVGRVVAPGPAARHEPLTDINGR